jgi:hypothetical protein
MRIRGMIALIITVSFITGSAPPSSAQTSSPTDNTTLLTASLRNSILIHGHQPFHLILKIAPAQKPNFRQAPSSMQGTMEVFWISPDRYKLVLDAPAFRQTKIVDGTQVEEHDEGDFYPRWLDNFVQALLNPTPKAQLPKLLSLRLTGGGTFAPPGRPVVRMPRCAETSERPNGITEETSVARICFESSNPWFQGMLDYTRYVSFSDFERFEDQMIPRTWSDDIPENIFVEGKVTLLEKLSGPQMKATQASSLTAPGSQIRTVFLSRKEIGDRIADVPDYEWPSQDTGKQEGYMIVYVRTDRAGKVRESYWNSSDNYGLQDAGVRLALKSSLKPLIVDGAPVQMEGPLVLHFKTSSAGMPSATSAE